MPPRDRINRLQQVMAEGGQKAFDVVPTMLANLIEEQEWAHRADRHGKLFRSFQSFVTAKLWEGLESSIDDLMGFCRKRPDVVNLIKAELTPIAGHGAPQGNQNAAKDKVQNKACNTRFEYGTATYTLRRLKRDRPDLAERVITGELSANAAAIEAGFRAKLTHLEIAIRAYRKLTPADQTIFWERVGLSRAAE